jgi:hypothetical protein
MVRLAPLTNSDQHFSSTNSILEQNKKGTAKAVPFISSAFSVAPCLCGENRTAEAAVPTWAELTSNFLVSYSIHEGAQLARSRRMTQLAQRFGFDLADAFAGYCEALPDFFQRVLAAIF